VAAVDCPAQLAWKYKTKFSAFTISPRHVPKGGRITISGRLLQDTSGWRGFGHQQVLIIYRKPGRKTSATPTTSFLARRECTSAWVRRQWPRCAAWRRAAVTGRMEF
jgi:hypothetical protein